MSRLGCARWVAQGGDWGAEVTTALGAMRTWIEDTYEHLIHYGEAVRGGHFELRTGLRSVRS